MEWKYSGEMLKHLEKQREILMQAYRSLSHELHTLQVEEEMLMRKLHELVPADHPSEKNNIGQSTADNREGANSRCISLLSTQWHIAWFYSSCNI